MLGEVMFVMVMFKSLVLLVSTTSNGLGLTACATNGSEMITAAYPRKIELKRIILSFVESAIHPMNKGNNVPVTNESPKINPVSGTVNPVDTRNTGMKGTTHPIEAQKEKRATLGGIIRRSMFGMVVVMVHLLQWIAIMQQYFYLQTKMSILVC